MSAMPNNKPIIMKIQHHKHSDYKKVWQTINPFKPRGVKWLHFRVFRAILV